MKNGRNIKKSILGKNAEIRIEKSSDKNNVQVGDIKDLIKLSDKPLLRVPDPILTTSDTVATISKNFQPILHLFCELENSNKETIDSYFDKNKNVLLKDRKEHVIFHFLQDSLFLAESRALLYENAPQNDTDLVTRVLRIKSKDPACYEALPRIINYIPKLDK